MEAIIEAAKRRCISLEERVNKNALNSYCKQTLVRLIHSELSFLSRISSNNTLPNLPLSLNIGYLEVVIHILEQPFITGVSRVCKPITLLVPKERHKDTANSKGVHVDIVCTLNRDPVWFIVSDRNPKYISWDGNGSSSNKGLKLRLEHVLHAASSSVTLKPSSIILFFANGLENGVIDNIRDEFGATDFKMDFSCFDCGFCEELEGEWIDIIARSYKSACVLEIKVDRPESSSSPCPNFGIKETLLGASRPELSVEDVIVNYDSLRSFVSQLRLPLLDVKDAWREIEVDSSCKSDVINFDTTALIAVVSGISNGHMLLIKPENELKSRFKGNYEFVIAQVTSEIEDPIHPVLGGVVSGKVGIICETVLSEFKELVSMCGGPNEKLRAEYLLKHLIAVPDTPTTRVMRLPTTRKLALKNKIVFGTGDHWRAPTLTANMAFVRAVTQTGMSLSTIEHRPRALTGD